jgi:type I restriction enzyme, S subunit
MSATPQEQTAQIANDYSGPDLPEGWAVVTLPDVCELNPPKPKRDALPAEATVTFVPMPALDAKAGAITAPKIRRFSEVRKGFTAFRDGDVIFAKITPCMENGKSAIARRLENGFGFGSTEFHVLRPTIAVLPEFIYYFVRQESYRRAAESEMTGSVGQKRVPVEFLKNTELRLPPIAEQKRIVAKIEELFARVDASRERLSKTAFILERFRQSVLAAACSGRLTEDWRKNNPPGGVAVIIEAIRRRRESQAHSVVQKEKLREIYEKAEEGDASELPESWRFATLNMLCTSFDYGTSAKSQPSGKVPVLRMGNVQRGEIDWTDLVFTSDSKEIRQYSLQPNTVLFNRTNSPELVGKTALYRGERPAIFAGYLIRIAHLPELDPQYLNLCLNTKYAREFCSRAKTDGVSQSNINAQKLGAFEVPFCPLTEQLEIVRRVESLFKLADTIEKRVEVATKRAEKLTQAILARAFRGELVPTEAELARREGREYEPASALLSHIRAECEAQTASGPAEGRGKVRKRREDVPKFAPSRPGV